MYWRRSTGGQSLFLIVLEWNSADQCKVLKIYEFRLYHSFLNIFETEKISTNLQVDILPARAYQGDQTERERE